MWIVNFKIEILLKEGGVFLNIFDAKPHLTSYVAKYMDQKGIDFQCACEELEINPIEEISETEFPNG